MTAYNTNKDIFSLKPSEGLQQRLHIDFPLLVAFLAIFMISLTAIYSASNSNIDAVVNQAIKILISISAMAVVAQFSPLSYGRVGPWLFFLCLVLLILVLLIGETRNGATRWLNIGISFQPSELMKNAFDDCPIHCQWRSSTHCFFRWGIHHDCVGSILFDHGAARSWNLNPHCLLWTGCNFPVWPQKTIPSGGVWSFPCLPAIDVGQHASVSEKQGFSVLEPRIRSHRIWVSFNSI